MVGVGKHSPKKAIDSKPIEQSAPEKTSVQHSVPERLLARLHPLEIKVLPHLKDTTIADLCAATKMQEVEVMRAVQWLEAKGALTIDATASTNIILEANATNALEHNTMPELRLLQSFKDGAKETGDAAKKAGLSPDELGASIGILKKKDWVVLGKETSVTKEGEHTTSENYAPLKLLHKIKKENSTLESLSKEEQSLITELRGRKSYITLKEHKERAITLTDLGRELAKIDAKTLKFTDKLTMEDLQTGAWKEKKYRAFDVTAEVPSIASGKEHFVQEAIDYIRSIWIEMGFMEMEGNMVQTAFWNLDALFVPQDHPSRETQDTFYLETPGRSPIPRAIFDRVREAHETGGNTGSKGWRYTFSRTETEQLLLRTQTTALSAQTLLKIKDGKAPMPGKYFVIGKVFRNEALDWKHLFEFHQVEGIVVDPNVTFAQLVGYLKIFFAKMGFPKIRFRPHHFPYTEPSVEVDVWNERKGEWVELGGAGVFRPEVTKTLLGEEVPVLAWGLGLERIIVEYFDLHDLRDLYRNDIKQLREMKRFVKIEKEDA
jgi:phenylalanyl-tRNA synthetase alpha chain